MEEIARFEARMDTVERQGAEHTHRLANVEAAVKGLGVKMDSVGGQLNSIVQALTKVEAAPRVDLVKLLTVTKDLAILGGLIATLLGFIINSYGSEKRAVLEYRMTQAEKYMESTRSNYQSKTDRQP